MKYSKTSAVFLAVAILLQLAIPCVYIAEKNVILKRGTEYRIRVEYLEFDDGKIELNYNVIKNYKDDELRYASLKNPQNGEYQYMQLTSLQPEEGPYIKSASLRKYRSPVDEYPMTDLEESDAYQSIVPYLDNGRYFYSTVVIYNGKAILTGVFLDDGTPVENIF